MNGALKLYRKRLVTFLNIVFLFRCNKQYFGPRASVCGVTQIEFVKMINLYRNTQNNSHSAQLTYNDL